MVSSLCFGVFVFGLSYTHAQSSELDSLLTEFRSLSGLSTRFREEKKIALLAAPIRSEGEIHFAPPGRLLRKVISPMPSTALIAQGSLTFASEGERQEFDLHEQPLVAGFVDSFRYVLAGDRQALERTYTISFQESENGVWELRLRPRSEPLDQFLREMVLRGRSTQVQTMRMIEVSGDETQTEFFDTDVNKEWTTAEIERTFRLP